MSIPAWFIVPLMGLTFSALVALFAKIAVFCLFQRSLGMRKAVALAVSVHLLSLVAALIGAQLMTMWTSGTAAKVSARPEGMRRLHETPRDGPDSLSARRQLRLAMGPVIVETLGFSVNRIDKCFIKLRQPFNLLEDCERDLFGC